jgi:hypothetical protein
MSGFDRFLEGLPYLLGGLLHIALMAFTPVYFVLQVHVALKLWRKDRWICVLPAFLMVPATLSVLLLVSRGMPVIAPALLALGVLAFLSICALAVVLTRDHYRKT